MLWKALSYSLIVKQRDWLAGTAAVQSIDDIVETFFSRYVMVTSRKKKNVADRTWRVLARRLCRGANKRKIAFGTDSIGTCILYVTRSVVVWTYGSSCEQCLDL